ncbi:hypothetical protein, partial [Streptomyces fragilis]|uniref:hypothetical protein n=1 Tax=Streptomyces fragilis TaxID=67301 RepID=UPI0024DEE2C2
AASLRESTPATCAAVTSPIECPATPVSYTHRDVYKRQAEHHVPQRPFEAVSYTHRDVYKRQHRVSSSSAPSPNTTSRSGRSRCTSNAAHTSSCLLYTSRCV